MATSSTPTITGLRVIPVAGRDSMLLNLSGAHGPFFTRNLLLLTDSAGRTGVGEVPGGEKIRQTLEDARELIVGQPLGSQQRLLQAMQKTFADRDAGGRQGTSVRKGRTVEELMTTHVVTVEPTTTVRKAANLMRGRSIGCVVVTERGRIVGIVTVTDLLELLGRGSDRPVTTAARWTLKHRTPHRKRVTATGVW